ncbi:mechanosensitive ion channel family protein [Kineococcus gynurae]|uniref:Mechanosensitive ion channel family protein n=1 Tax=Kineococcus gynurae TaxID=452979 RepID=A0ABV5LW35_9ACTN
MLGLTLPDGVLTGTASPLANDVCTTDSPNICGVVHGWTGSSWAGLISSVLVQVLLILVIGFVARYLLLKVIDRTVAGIAAGGARVTRNAGRRNGLMESSPLLSERRHQRAETLGSVLKSTATLVIGVLVVLMVLAQLDLNIAPFIASAGIVGVALGFGAQSLVKDFLSGIFMLAEDQYGVGDVVDLGDASGTVEAVGLRVTRVRDVNGTVWYVRNGEILRVGNQSQGWARAVIDVSVTYESDLSHVHEVLQRVGDKLAAEDEWKALVIGPVEVWGVEAMDTGGVVLRLVVKTAPLQQWAVQRELRRRIKAVFDAEGIEIPYLQSTVWLRNEERHPPRAPRAGARAASTVHDECHPPPPSEADVAAESAQAPGGQGPAAGAGSAGASTPTADRETPAPRRG